MNKILFIIMIIFINLQIYTEEYRDNIFNFKFNFDKKISLLNNNDNLEKINIYVIIKNINEFSNDLGPLGISERDYILKLKNMISRKKYEIIIRGVESNIIESNIINIGNYNVLYELSYTDNSSFTNKKYINNVNANIVFFKNNNIITINIKCEDNIPKIIKDEALLIYEKYFKKEITIYGAEFKDKDSGIKLFNEIKRGNKELPKQLLDWYKVFNEVLDTLEIF